MPACVETCVGGIRIFGDLNDPDSPVRRLLDKNQVKVLKREMGTKPHVFYIGLDKRFQGQVEGEGTLWKSSGHGVLNHEQSNLEILNVTRETAWVLGAVGRGPCSTFS